MPNRIIKESICTSDNIDQLSPFAEIAFYRLMVNCDDFGRMDARPKILISRLFPLKEVSESDMKSWLKELEEADLVILYEHNGKPYLQMKTWSNHQQVRNQKSKYPSPDEADCKQNKTKDNNCKQLISNDSKCPRNPIQSESLSESLSLSEQLVDDDEAHQIQNEQNRVLDAAEDAGFKMSNDVRTSLIALYADYGLDKMLDGYKSCVKHGAPNLAYLEACLRGDGKKKQKTVEAQNYGQRDYKGEQDEAMKRMVQMMEGA